jgi:hypothetical protein
MDIKIIAVFCPLLIAGCVGGGAIVTKTNVTPVSNLPASQHYVCPSKQVGVLTTCEPGDISSPTIDSFFTAWGKPTSTKHSGSTTLIKYNINVVWRGLVLFAIVPIPLMFPAGHNHLILTFSNDRLVEVKSEFGDGTFPICGIHEEANLSIDCLLWQ